MKETGQSSRPDLRLPERLFATNRFPRKRLNIYSKPDILCFIRHHLRGSEEFEVIRRSCFGGLFNLPARQCPVSHKLIHSLLSRQICVRSQHQLWPVVAGKPFRFSLAEFETVTGLPCGPFPDQYQSPLFNSRNAAKDPLWQKLLGHDSLITVADIGHMIETEEDMPSDKRLRLALIMIVDGVLIAHKQIPRPTLQYVQMVDNVEDFLTFPWGRESYLKTIICMKPPIDEVDPVGTLVKLLQQETYRLQGFPLALQLVAFQAMPLLATKIPAPQCSTTLLDLEDPNLPLHNSVNINDFEQAEADPKLRVTPIITLAENASSWGDEPEDERAHYMEELIAQNHEFHIHDWPGGDSSEPEFIVKHTVPIVHRKQTVPKKESLKVRKGSKKTVSTTRKQRRISTYFKRNVGATPPNNQWLGEKIEQLDIFVAELKAETRWLRRKLSRRQPLIGSKFSKFKSALRTPRKQTTTQEDESAHAQPQQHDHIHGEADHRYPTRQSLQVTKGIKKASSSARKQKTVFKNTKANFGASPPTNEWLAEKVEQLQGLVAELKTETRQLSRKLERLQTKKTAKPRKRSQRSQDEETTHTQPLQHDHNSEAPMESDPSSPLIRKSQEEEPTHTQPQQHDHNSGAPMESDHSSPLIRNSQGEDPTHTQPHHHEHNIEATRESDPSSPLISQYNAQRFSNYTFGNTITDSPTDIIKTPSPGATPNSNNLTDDFHNQITTGPTSPAGVSSFHVSLEHISPPNTSPPHSYQTNNPATPTKHTTTEVASATTPAKNSPNGFTSHAKGANAFAERASKVVNSSTTGHAEVKFNEDQDTGSSVAKPSTTVATEVILNEGQDTGSLPVKSSTTVGSEDKLTEGQETDSSLVYLSDSSPARPVEKHVPTEPEIELAKQLMNCKTVPAPKLITKVDPKLWKLFSSTLKTVKNIEHVNPLTTAFSNESLLKLATPKQWVSSTDMEILMYHVGQTHKSLLAEEQSIFLSPWLTSYIQKKWRQFNAAYDKEKFRWDRQLSNLVLLPGQTWVSNIHTLYAPMIWGDKHWVGLAINLPLSLVEVLDSLPALYDDTEVQQFLEPVLAMLPFIINKLTTNSPSQFAGDRPFQWIRRNDLYKNIREGDCGPLSVKFMEMHANGDPESTPIC